MAFPRLNPAVLTAKAIDPDRLAGAATLALVAMLAYAAAQLVWRLVPTAALRTAADGGSAAASAPLNVDAELAAAVARINALEMFGPLSADSLPDGANAPETRLDLALRGVIATGDEATARAFIAASGGEERAYAIGAALPGGAKLHAVLPDRVTLERNGQLETLRLPREGEGGAATGSAARIAQVSAADVRAVAEGNPQRLLDVVRPVAATDSNTGRMLGYRVYPGRDAERFARLGLQPGDLIVSVNGVSLDDPSRGLEILKSLTSSDAVSLMVERDGQQRLLQVPVTR
jgi:general secretion pathway protein C